MFRGEPAALVPSTFAHTPVYDEKSMYCIVDGESSLRMCVVATVYPGLPGRLNRRSLPASALVELVILNIDSVYGYQIQIQDTDMLFGCQI